jgi:hypothetical protein
MRKTTINVVSGVLLGIFATTMANKITPPAEPSGGVKPMIATTVSVPRTEIRGELEILEIPPPLDMAGLHPFETYLNGKPIKIPYDMVRELVVAYRHTMDLPRGRTRSLNEQRMTYVFEEEDIHGIAGE